MTKFKVSSPILVNVLVIFIGVQASQIRLHLTKVECQNFADDIVSNFTCEMHRRNERDSPTFYTQLLLTEDLYNITHTVKIRFVQGNGPNGPKNYLTQTIDGCVALSELQSNLLLEKLRNEIRRACNLPFKCPIKKKILYYVKDFSGENLDLPSYLPPWTLISDSSTYSNGRKLITIVVTGRIERYTRKSKKYRNTNSFD